VPSAWRRRGKGLPRCREVLYGQSTGVEEGLRPDLLEYLVVDDPEHAVGEIAAVATR